jgi:[NiFe] hydrogenase diaphorase moiety large subunit
MGAGAYVCGEESALIESAEGKKASQGTDPFPSSERFHGQTNICQQRRELLLCCKDNLEGGEWFAKMGTAQSKGTKLLSVLEIAKAWYI